MEFIFQRAYRGPVKLVVFDWAGTTIDYGCCAPAAAFIEGFRRKGISITMAQAREPMGLGKWDHIKAIGEMPSVAQQWQEAYGRALTDDDVDTLYTDFVPVLLDILRDYSTLIPGTVETVDYLRQKGVKIGGTTGYFEAAMRICQESAAGQGYEPDSSVCATQVSAGRPAPWMIFRVMDSVSVYPPQAVVKVGDTRPDISEGLNAGTWTIGVAQAGNQVGLTHDELMALPADDRQLRIEAARQDLAREGAHYVVDTISGVPKIIELIEERLFRGERP